jgi:TonB family C-terminal domain
MDSQDIRLKELLERWQSGQFTRADEQELRALTDSDEFRRDAAGGYWELPDDDHGQRIRSLHARLRAKNGTAQRFNLAPWLAAAAVTGLLVWALWQVGPDPSVQKPIAEERAPTAPIEPSGETPGEATDKRAEQAPVVTAPSVRQGPAAAPIAAADKSTASETYVAPAKPSPPEIAAAPPPALAKEERPAESQALRSTSNESKTADVPNDDGLDGAPGNASAKKSKAQPDQDRAKKMNEQTSASSEPAEGWEAWQDYLRQNARLPETARQNNVSGKVLLQFRVGEDGRPVDFQILRSLGYGCDEEAIRLVKSYNWKRGANPTLKVEIPFIR